MPAYISCNKVSAINDNWSKSRTKVHNSFIKGTPIHSTIDNNDGHKETINGSGTTHHMNCTWFQPILNGEHIELEPKSNLEEIAEDDDDFNRIPEYMITTLVPFMFYTKAENTNLLFECI